MRYKTVKPEKKVVRCGEHSHNIYKNEFGSFELPLCFINALFRRPKGPPYVYVEHERCGIAFYCELTETMDYFPGIRKLDGTTPKNGELFLCGSCNKIPATGSLEINVPVIV